MLDQDDDAAAPQLIEFDDGRAGYPGQRRRFPTVFERIRPYRRMTSAIVSAKAFEPRPYATSWPAVAEAMTSTPQALATRSADRSSMTRRHALPDRSDVAVQRQRGSGQVPAVERGDLQGLRSSAISRPGNPPTSPRDTRSSRHSDAQAHKQVDGRRLAVLGSAVLSATRLARSRLGLVTALPARR